MEDTYALVNRAVGGDKPTIRALVARVGPVVRTAVARVLYRYKAKARGRDLATESEDMAQEALLTLFEDNAKVLGSWSPARGASLETFVRIVAERTAFSILRSGKRSPFTEEPTDQDNFGEFASHAPSAERRAISQDALVRLHDRLKSQLTPRGYILFLRLFVEEGDVDVVARDLGIARDAVYAWKYRFAGALKGIAADLDPAILEGFP